MLFRRGGGARQDSGAAQETVTVTATTATTFTATTVNAHNGTVTPFAVVNDPTLIAAIDALAAANQQTVNAFFAVSSRRGDSLTF